MQFFRSGSSGERRRRVLTEGLLSGQANKSSSKQEKNDGEGSSARAIRYGDPTLLARQMRLVDLIPIRKIVLAGWFLLGLIIIAGLEALYAWMPQWASHTGDGRIASFDLDGEGSLAVWFSCTVLSLAGVFSMVVYGLRKHRGDDYQGRYRVWLAAAVCWFVMSLDECSSLHEGFKELMSHLTGRRLSGDGSLWWVMPYVLVLGVVGIRLLMEVRESRGALAALLAVAGSYMVAVVSQVGILFPDSGAYGVMIEEGAEMTGNLFLVLFVAVYARNVILEIQGLLPERTSWKKTPKASAVTVESSTSTPSRHSTRRSDLDTVAPAGNYSAPSSAAKIQAEKWEEEHERTAKSGQANRKYRIDPPESEVDEPSEEGNQRLTKAQRKALRKQKQREREDW